MAEPIGSLRAELSANSAAFHADMMAARNSVRTAGAAMQRSFMSIRTAASNAYRSVFSLRSALMGGTAAGMVLFLKRMANMADEIKSQSAAIGVTAEQYQEFIFMATQMGASAEGSAKSLGIFTRVIGDAATGSKSAQQALANVGLTFADLAGKTPLESLSIVADRLRSMEDPTLRASAAADLLGRGWQELMPVLMNGGAAMDALREKAQAMGLVVSNEMIDKAADANDKFDILSQVFRVAGINLAAEFLPALTKLADIVTSAAFQQGVADFAQSTKDVLTYISDNIGTIEKWAAAMAGAYAGMKLGRFLGPYGAIAGGMAGAVGGIGLTSEDPGMKEAIQKQLNAIENFGGANITLPETIVHGDDEWDPWKVGGSDKWEKQLQSIRDRIAAMQEEARTFGMSTYEIERNKMALELRQQAQEQGIKIDTTVAGNIENLSELYANQVVALDNVRLAHERQQAAAQEAFSIVKDGFKEWIKGGKEFSEILVDVASKFADMAIEAAAMKFFAPASGGQAGGTFGAIFSGIGKLFGFDTGASFRVGGSGAPDSKLVSFRASPGEIVDVRRPGQDMGGGTNIQQVFHFNNVDPTLRPWIQQQLEKVRTESIAAANTSVRLGRANDPNYFPIG